MAEIERVIQSNEDFVIDSGLILEVTIVDLPSGGIGKRFKYVNTDKFLCDKKCILQIQNDDEMCCARAIVTAKARLDKHPKWESIRKGYEPQSQMAKQLHEQVDVPLGKCSIEDIKKFQKILSSYQIHVVSKEHFNAIIYSGPEAVGKIYLYYHDDHFDVITSMAAFLSKSYFCTKCQKGYSNKEQHKCNDVCHACRKVHDQNQEDWIQCHKCKRFFKGQECFDLHRRPTAKGNSTCKKIYRCNDCGKTVNRGLDKNHQCGQIYCKLCEEFYPEGHKCYMKPEDKQFQPDMSIEEELVDEEENAKTFIFFSFECSQADLIQCEQGYSPDLYGKCTHCLKAKCGAYEHRPNLCVAQKVCTLCMEKTDDCELCGQREYIFAGENSLNAFCEWLFSEKNYNATNLCHNFQGYDSYPILQYLYQNAIIPSVVANGAKIMSLTVPHCKIKMIDSINFLPMALAKLPEMFGFSELKKGYFPHMYNTKDHQNVVMDTLLNISYYTPDDTKPEAREKFLIWYEQHKHDHKTLQKRHYLESQCYTYRSIWESDFDQQCQDDPEVKTFVESLDIVTPLEPRDAFYGGRTEAYTLYKEASEEEDIDYYDVTSLYPWVNKTGKIPIGHPEIITENFRDLDKYEGLIKCKVLPQDKHALFLLCMNLECT